MANIAQINGFEINAQTASLALTASLARSASSVLVDRETVNGPAYLTYVDSSNPSGEYEFLYTNDSVYLTGSTLISTRISSSFTGSLLGTASYATQALSASFAPNALITASVSLNTITFTKGNGSTFPITVNTGSGGGTGGGTNLGLVYAASLGYLMP